MGNWRVRVTIIADNTIKKPALESAVYNFLLGYNVDRDEAEKCWKSLGFCIPEKAVVQLEEEEVKYIGGTQSEFTGSSNEAGSRLY